MTLATLQCSAPAQFEFAQAPKAQDNDLSFAMDSASVPALVETLGRQLTPEQIEQLWGEMSDPAHPAHERCTIL
ncbi:hypothetical protein B0O80DRAFT_494819 [Mortierella sp. GBAus27b]|nr:hypothetical protein BGX31_004733 [Mortierella sp. GBA43]KAI8359252.1 hypothetical protein B0O80DRAFT_494819 [Mortierella sp. GBAus27b]